MERRFDARFPSDLRVRITDLEGGTGEMEGTLLNISESGICVCLQAPKPTDSLVKLEFADTVLYGQIAYCHEEDGKYRTGIAVERVLVRASDLTNILESLLEHAESSVPTAE